MQRSGSETSTVLRSVAGVSADKAGWQGQAGGLNFTGAVGNQGGLWVRQACHRGTRDESLSCSVSLIDRDCQWLIPHTYPCSARAHPDDLYEVKRARELNQLLGPMASGRAFDFVLDLHNTTANMGTCLIVDTAHNVFAMHLYRHLQVALLPQIGRVEREHQWLWCLHGWGCGGGGSLAPVPGAGHPQIPQALWTPHPTSPRGALCFLYVPPHLPS